MTSTPDPSPEVDPVSSEAPPEETPAPVDDPLRGSLVSRTWAALVALGVLIVLTVAFVAQNTESVPLHLFGWTWNPPLAAALLAAFGLGLGVALVSGSLRILQLRRRVRRNIDRR